MLCANPQNQLPIGTLDGLDAFDPAGEPGFGLPLDAGIRRFVLILRSQGIETFESCEGGPGHPYPEPTIRFHGDAGEGWRAVGVCLTYQLPIENLRRFWSIDRAGEPSGPHWEITFRERSC